MPNWGKTIQTRCSDQLEAGEKVTAGCFAQPAGSTARRLPATVAVGTRWSGGRATARWSAAGAWLPEDCSKRTSETFYGTNRLLTNLGVPKMFVNRKLFSVNGLQIVIQA